MYNKWSKVIHETQSVQILQMQDGRNIYAIIKLMYPPGYHHNDFMATHALGHTMYGSLRFITIQYGIFQNKAHRNG